MRTGILTRRGRDIPLARINDVSFQKGPLDRLLGSGRLTVESAGEHGQIVLTDIPQVEQVHSTLFRLTEEEQRRLERNERTQPFWRRSRFRGTPATAWPRSRSTGPRR
jgi:uncharacterized membrane protein YdbT with pleckstrin-like domain